MPQKVKLLCQMPSNGALTKNFYLKMNSKTKRYNFSFEKEIIGQTHSIDNSYIVLADYYEAKGLDNNPMHSFIKLDRANLILEYDVEYAAYAPFALKFRTHCKLV